MVELLHCKSPVKANGRCGVDAAMKRPSGLSSACPARVNCHIFFVIFVQVVDNIRKNTIIKTTLF